MPVAARSWCEDPGALPHLVPEGECEYELADLWYDASDDEA